mgnify:CR=1 FL=1
MGADGLFAELGSAGVVMWIEGDRLAFDAPAGVITDDLLGRMRAERDGLLWIVADRDRGDVDTKLDRPTTIRCPRCDGINLVDDSGGLRCCHCDRLAWVATSDGGLARCDVAESVIELVDPDSVPICPACERWCDVITLAESWHCSRCSRDADDRRRRTLRALSLISRSRGRSVQRDR